MECTSQVLERAIKKNDLDDFKKWLKLPDDIAQHAHFSASNASNWVDIKKYKEYLRAAIGRSGVLAPSTSPLNSRTSFQTPKKREYIILSDDSDTGSPCNPRSQVKRIKTEPIEVIELLSDSEDEAKPVVQTDMSHNTRKTPIFTSDVLPFTTQTSQPTKQPPSTVSITTKRKVDQ
ncbi:hypothetical protein H0H92_013840, partial [Tricholoma furcatifolium]